MDTTAAAARVGERMDAFIGVTAPASVDAVHVGDGVGTVDAVA